jgi:hypothetical protein
MREYDGIEKRYRKSDFDLEKNLNIIEKLLGFRPTVEQLDFDLSFYSGGIGIYDKLAISCTASLVQKKQNKEKLNLFSPESAITMREWVEDFVWLVESDDTYSDILVGSAKFINENKSDFQDVCLPSDEMFFSYESNVNDWAVVWGNISRFNYAYLNQG